MKFLSTRDLGNRPGLVRELAQQEDLVLTSNGKPIAILLGVGEEDMEETAHVVRQARAQRALSRMRQEAARRGIERTSSSSTDAHIRSSRSRRRSG